MTDPVQMLHHRGKPIVEFAPQLLNLFGVDRELLLLPSVTDGTQDRRQPGEEERRNTRHALALSLRIRQDIHGVREWNNKYSLTLLKDQT